MRTKVYSAPVVFEYTRPHRENGRHLVNFWPIPIILKQRNTRNTRNYEL